MKKQIILLFLIISSIFTQSQDLKTGVIYYDHIDNHYNESYNSYIVFNQNNSYFVTAKDSLGISNMDKIRNSNDENVLVESVYFNDVKKTRKEGLQVYLNKLTDSIYFVNAFTLTSKMIYSKEKRPKIKWKLENETKKIGRFICHKASAHFRGREYICWYTREIPLPYGPWKLQGLPGIILEANSKDGFFKIIFKKIKYPVKNIRIPLSENSILKKGQKFISFEEYKFKQDDRITTVENSLKIQAKKFNIQMDPFSEKDNFLEVFGH